MFRRYPEPLRNNLQQKLSGKSRITLALQLVRLYRVTVPTSGRIWGAKKMAPRPHCRNLITSKMHAPTKAKLSKNVAEKMPHPLKSRNRVPKTLRSRPGVIRKIRIRKLPAVGRLCRRPAQLFNDEGVLDGKIVEIIAKSQRSASSPYSPFGYCCCRITRSKFCCSSINAVICSSVSATGDRRLTLRVSSITDWCLYYI